MRKLLFALMLFAVPASAQTTVDLDIDVAVGGGFMLSGEEEQAFDADSLYVAVHWNGMKLPGPDVTTGVGIEFHPATIVVNGGVVNVDYRIWNLNRFNCLGRTYCLADLKIGEGVNGGYAADFDQRVGFGMLVAKQARFEVNFEMYFLEDDRPVAALVSVRFGGSNQ